AVASRRFNMIILVAFAALALLLAAVGIYGVMAYTVTMRAHEIGVRMALGAQPRQVLRLVIGQGLLLALAGIGSGLAAALILTRFMSGLLFEVRSGDPATLMTVAIFLTSIALIASFVPARRAMRMDPMVALRYE